jgi:ligand-binding sensor domain-containing protein/signal transduction histidine kinase
MPFGIVCSILKTNILISLLVQFLRVVIGAVLFVPMAAALDPAKSLTQYAHRVWGHEEGLFQPTVFAITQSRDGFLWLGTEDGLVRFDGLHFRDFERYGKPVFEHTLIHDLAEDKRGDLWVASLGAGVAELTADGSLERYTTKNGLPSDSVFCVTSDHENRIWMCTAEGLVKLQQGHLRTYTTADGLPSNKIRATCETPDGVRWVAGLDFGLARLRGARFEPYASNQIPLGETVTALLCGSDGNVWIGTESGVVQMRDTWSRRLSVRNGLPDNAVSALAFDSAGALWIGTNDGISRYQNGEISVYRTRDGLSHSLVQSLYFDREGTLWAGTKDGLDEFTDGDVTPYTANEGLSSNAIGPVIVDRTGRLWIGTLNCGLNWFDGRRFHSITTRNGLSDNAVLSLASDDLGNLWVGTRHGLNCLRNGRVIRIYTDHDGLSGSEIQSLMLDDGHTLWVGTNNGLDRFNGSRFEQIQTVSPASVIALGRWGQASLFAANMSAFYLFEQGKWRAYHLDSSRPVDCYYVDFAKHVTWMGTLGSGLLRWHNGVLTHIRIKDGLYDNRIYSILADDNNNLWFASSKGIFQVSERELNDFAEGKLHEITIIPFSTGQLRFECQPGVQPAAVRTRDGRLWFATNNGLVVIDPRHLREHALPPPVAITAIVINGQRFDPKDHLCLKPSEKNVEIRYAGLSFVSPEKIAFRYRLNGFDRGWTNAGTRREAFFTNLPPGNFQFEVLAQSAAGMWSPEAATISFRIAPRFYQRIWFFPILLMVTGLLIATAWRMRVRRLRSNFDLVLAERSRIARELHDTLLQGLSGITMQMQALWARLPASKEKSELGEIIADAARCSAEARRSLWGLRASGERTAKFSDKLANLVRESKRDSAKSLRLNLDIEPFELRLNPDAEYQTLCVVKEAVSNAIRHADASRLTVSASILGTVLRIVIEDNGIGFPIQTAQSQLGHFGLLGMQERAKEIGADLLIDSSPGRGTRISLELPLHIGHTDLNNYTDPVSRRSSDVFVKVEK